MPLISPNALAETTVFKQVAVLNWFTMTNGIHLVDACTHFQSDKCTNVMAAWLLVEKTVLLNGITC